MQLQEEMLLNIDYNDRNAIFMNYYTSHAVAQNQLLAKLHCGECEENAKIKKY
jgi:hypothetical protein